MFIQCGVLAFPPYDGCLMNANIAWFMVEYEIRTDRAEMTKFFFLQLQRGPSATTLELGPITLLLAQGQFLKFTKYDGAISHADSPR